MGHGVFPSSFRSLSLLVILLSLGCAAGAQQADPPVPDQGVRPTRADPGGGAEARPAPRQEGQEDRRPGVGVWPFSNGGSFGDNPWDYEALGIGLQQMLITELAQNAELRLVERGRLREIIDELDLSRSGYVDSGTTARVGRLVQARYMIVGGFVDANGTMRLDARIDDVETGEVLVETAAKVQGDRDHLLDLVVDLAGKLTEAAHLPPLPEQIAEERKSLDYPPEAIQLYSRALRREERGDMDGMVELLRQLTTEFPQHIEGRQMLQQYGIGLSGPSPASVRRSP